MVLLFLEFPVVLWNVKNNHGNLLSEISCLFSPNFIWPILSSFPILCNFHSILSFSLREVLSWKRALTGQFRVHRGKTTLALWSSWRTQSVCPLMERAKDLPDSPAKWYGIFRSFHYHVSMLCPVTFWGPENKYLYNINVAGEVLVLVSLLYFS